MALATSPSLPNAEFHNPKRLTPLKAKSYLNFLSFPSFALRSSRIICTRKTLPVTASLKVYSLSDSFFLSSHQIACFSSSFVFPPCQESVVHFKKNWRDFTNLNYWVVRDYYRLVDAVNSLEPHIVKLSDEQLTAKTDEFRSRLREGETVADIQAEAFAIVREAAKRKLGMRHFDVQIIGGAVLHDGSIAEMKTGEGKTLVSTLAAYLNALTGNGVHGNAFATSCRCLSQGHLQLLPVLGSLMDQAVQAQMPSQDLENLMAQGHGILQNVLAPNVQVALSVYDSCVPNDYTGDTESIMQLAFAVNLFIVTVNDYLAQRDAEWMGRVHRFLGLSVGLIQSGMTSEERRDNYNCDITYTNNSVSCYSIKPHPQMPPKLPLYSDMEGLLLLLLTNALYHCLTTCFRFFFPSLFDVLAMICDLQELGFDYLRDNLAGNRERLVMRWPKPFHFAIVDEVDSVLIDEGRNPLLISGEATKDAARYPVAAKVAELLVQGLHYSTELKDNSVEMTEEGVALAEMALETNDLWDENDPWARGESGALRSTAERKILGPSSFSTGISIHMEAGQRRKRSNTGIRSKLAFFFDHFDRGG
ncbi:hypothetical protein ACLOJK_014042 [Asimina triloba]